MGEDRTLLPTELSPLSLQAYFGTLDSNNNSTFFCDYLTLNGWVDSSGGMKNALVLVKLDKVYITTKLIIQVTLGPLKTNCLYRF